jgi:RsiW-degrading membrane proteinase PrsW (M82 family)
VILVVLAMLLALAIGLGANYYSGWAKDKEPTEGAAVTSVLGATALLAAFIVALVLSGTASSYAAANTASKNEADVVDTLYESAEYVDQPFREKIQAAAACYARAVAGPEWEAMEKGERSPVPNNWTGTGPNGIRRQLIAMGTGAKGFSLVQSADARRGDLRNERVRQSNPTVPDPLFWLMIVLVAISLGSLAFGIPRAGNIPHLVALVVVTVLFIATVGLLYNLDRPFSGVLAQKPTDMQTTAEDVGEDYTETYNTQPPCNDRGEPVAPE